MPGDVVVIGVGNPYRRDDGLGAAVIAALRQRYVRAELRTCLGETTELIDAWDGAELAVVVDAVVTEPPDPGRVHRLTVYRPTRRGGSTHGQGLGEAIELARVLGRLPGQLILYAVGVADTGHGTGLSPLVAEAVDGVVAEIVATLAARDATTPDGVATVPGPVAAA